MTYGILLGLTRLIFTNNLIPVFWNFSNSALEFPLEREPRGLAIGLALTAMNSNDAAFPGVVYGTFMYLPCAAMVLFGRRYLASPDPPLKRR